MHAIQSPPDGPAATAPLPAQRPATESGPGFAVVDVETTGLGRADRVVSAKVLPSYGNPARPNQTRSDGGATGAHDDLHAVGNVTQLNLVDGDQHVRQAPTLHQ